MISDPLLIPSPGALIASRITTEWAGITVHQLHITSISSWAEGLRAGSIAICVTLNSAINLCRIQTSGILHFAAAAVSPSLHILCNAIRPAPPRRPWHLREDIEEEEMRQDWPRGLRKHLLQPRNPCLTR